MKIFKLLLILALGLQIGFAENNEQSEQLNDNSKIFKNQNDDYDANGACSWHCREVNDGYRTLITGFDWKSGTTKCNVYKQTDSGETPLTSVNANRTVKACSLAENMDDEAMELYGQLFDGSDKYSSKGSSIKYDSNQQGIRLSQFMAALVTLDPSIIDRAESTKRGQIALTANGQLFKFTNITLPTDTFYANNEISFKAMKENFFNSFTKIANSALGNKGLDVIPLSAQTTSALDGFNKNNMAYFSDLFGAMEKIYQHLQIFIFILIGGFFVMQIGASFLIKGENNENF